jgi:hypothetical protein
LNRADTFKELSRLLIDSVNEVKSEIHNHQSVTSIMEQHIRQSRYSSRLLEVSMHALVQSFADLGFLGMRELKPLSQMRSANKKHGNIGDVEIMEENLIVEAWDAKFGKTSLCEEVEELSDKIQLHNNVKVVGFVTIPEVERTDDFTRRVTEIESSYGVELKILTFREWIGEFFNRVDAVGLATEAEAARGWLAAYAESIGQMRRDIAPIDEPCEDWVTELTAILCRYPH